MPQEAGCQSVGWNEARGLPSSWSWHLGGASAKLWLELCSEQRTSKKLPAARKEGRSFVSSQKCSPWVLPMLKLYANTLSRPQIFIPSNGQDPTQYLVCSPIVIPFPFNLT